MKDCLIGRYALLSTKLVSCVSGTHLCLSYFTSIFPLFTTPNAFSMKRFKHCSSDAIVMVNTRTTPLGGR